MDPRHAPALQETRRDPGPLEITGTLARGPLGACVWCGGSSTSQAFAPGVGRMVPCHVLCCARIIQAYKAWIRSGIEPPGWAEYAGRVRLLADPRAGGGE
jgi:hypothetical protein